jgi:hypothetical protein
MTPIAKAIVRPFFCARCFFLDQDARVAAFLSDCGAKKPRVCEARGWMSSIPEWFIIIFVHPFVVRAVAPIPIR